MYEQGGAKQEKQHVTPWDTMLQSTGEILKQLRSYRHYHAELTQKLDTRLRQLNQEADHVTSLDELLLSGRANSISLARLILSGKRSTVGKKIAKTEDILSIATNEVTTMFVGEVVSIQPTDPNQTILCEVVETDYGHYSETNEQFSEITGVIEAIDIDPIGYGEMRLRNTFGRRFLLYPLFDRANDFEPNDAYTIEFANPDLSYPLPSHR